jgi:hypothetical protein
LLATLIRIACRFDKIRDEDKQAPTREVAPIHFALMTADGVS